jgi:hypothetical protein
MKFSQIEAALRFFEFESKANRGRGSASLNWRGV